MIHFITMALGGEGYLNFMGNEVRNKAQPRLAKFMKLDSSRHYFFIHYTIYAIRFLILTTLNLTFAESFLIALF